MSLSVAEFHNRKAGNFSIESRNQDHRLTVHYMLSHFFWSPAPPQAVFDMQARH